MSNLLVKINGNEAAFKALFDNATVGILVIDSEGTIQLANPFIEKQFGYISSELVRQPVEILIPGAFKKKHIKHRQAYFNKPVARPMGYGLDLYGLNKAGDEFPVEISLSHYRFNDELLAVAFITDISQTKKARQQLLESEERYRLIFTGIHESFMLQEIIKDENGKIRDLRFLEINPATEALLQKTRDEVIGHLRSEFLGELDGELIDIIARVELTGKKIKYEQYIPNVKKWFDRSFYSPCPGQIITLSMDITERKKSDDALNKLNEAGNRLWRIDNLQAGLEEILSSAIELMLADKGDILLLEPETKRLSIALSKGFKPSYHQTLGKALENTNSPLYQAMNMRKQFLIDDMSNEPAPSIYPALADMFDIKTALYTPLYTQDGLPIGIISTYFNTAQQLSAHDLSKMELYARKAESFIEHFNMYETLLEMNTALEDKVGERTKELIHALEREKQLNEMKSRFVSMASHEFRTPLSAILSSVHLINQYTKEEQEDKRKKHTGRIASSVEVLTDILNDFLSLDKLEQGKVESIKETFDIHDFCKGLIEEMNGMLKEGQHIKFLHKGDGVIFHDKKTLRHILLNLLSNAVKYSKEFSEIGLTIETTTQSILISVKDEGIGIPEEEQKDLFKLFYRAKNALNIQGTGLGLNIVKKYIELLAGTISFTSKQNRGTTFIVELPRM